MKTKIKNLVDKTKKTASKIWKAVKDMGKRLKKKYEEAKIKVLQASMVAPDNAGEQPEFELPLHLTDPDEIRKNIRAQLAGTDMTGMMKLLNGFTNQNPAIT